MAIIEKSTVSAKGQTTVPRAVRQALGVTEGDRIAFRIDGDAVSLTKVAAQEDPALDRFLHFLARDIEQRPEAISALTPALMAHLADLTRGMSVDLDAPIEGKVDL